MALLVSNSKFAGEAAVTLAEDFAHGRRVDLGEDARRPWCFRAAVRVARLLSPVQ